MLSVSAGKIGDPVAFFIGMEVDDGPLDTANEVFPVRGREYERYTQSVR